jgi:hypothetical protein
VFGCDGGKFWFLRDQTEFTIGWEGTFSELNVVHRAIRALYMVLLSAHEQFQAKLPSEIDRQAHRDGAAPRQVVRCLSLLVHKLDEKGPVRMKRPTHVKRSIN